MTNYFNIRYEFDREEVHRAIDNRIKQKGGDYICVADGVILNEANRREDYREVVNSGMFSICDSSFVPLYINWIYGRKVEQYCGSSIFEDIVRSRKHRMIFLGASKDVLSALKQKIRVWNPDVDNMQFVELPFCPVEEFDYPAIAEIINSDGADIVWVALGAPKQEWFMHYLKPHLNHGVMIAVGAAFKFVSGTQAKRAPKWMIDHHLEFVYRIFSEPRKQLVRCSEIICSLPKLLFAEYRRKKHSPTVCETNI